LYEIVFDDSVTIQQFKHKTTIKNIKMTHTILIDCSDAKGLVHKVTGVLYHNDLNVVSNHEFVQPETGRFFMRTEIDGVMDADRIYNGLSGILPEDANVRITEQRKKRVVILVTKEHHALGELLIRHQFGELNAEVVAVIGNHDILRGFVGQFGLPFFHISHEQKTREVHELEVLAKINELKPDYIILAKYMRVLTPAFVENYNNRIINIHHSFLPAFIGANPYRQAYERGVKIIGATAHFVNNDLDEGPIIMQQVIPTDHTQSPQEMTQMGRDVEKITLAKALKLVFDDRVFVTGNKTIIFG
jgi:formyltetrahydrofolate deformylase